MVLEELEERAEKCFEGREERTRKLNWRWKKGDWQGKK